MNFAPFIDHTRKPIEMENASVRRLRSIAVHFNGGVALVSPASGVPPPSVAAMAKDRKLTDAQMLEFLSAGYLILPVDDLAPEFHEAIYQKTKTLYRVEDGGGVDFGNNIFPAVPELGEVFKSPSLVGAVSSVLGDNYCMHPHRHMHSRALGEGGTSDQGFHMDSYWGLTRTRHHAPRWCMCLYFPHDVVIEAGPTGIVPYSQYWEMPPLREGLGADQSSDDLTIRDAALAETCTSLDPSLKGLPLTCKAGSFVLMAYDVYHRGCRRMNDSADWRAMYKFQFFSTEARAEPSWDNKSAELNFDTARFPGRQTVVWDSMLDFVMGRTAQTPAVPLPSDVPADPVDAAQIMDAGATEAERAGAAYTLARLARGLAGPAASEAALDELGSALSSSSSPSNAAISPIGQDWRDDTRRAAMYGLSASGPVAVPVLLKLASMDPSTTVKIAAVHALSEAVTVADIEAVVSALLPLLGAAVAAIDAAAGEVQESTEGGQQKLLHSTILQTLGFVGQWGAWASIHMGGTSKAGTAVVEKIVEEAFLPVLLAPEPGAVTGHDLAGAKQVGVAACCCAVHSIWIPVDRLPYRGCLIVVGTCWWWYCVVVASLRAGGQCLSLDVASERVNWAPFARHRCPDTDAS